MLAHPLSTCASTLGSGSAVSVPDCGDKMAVSPFSNVCTGKVWDTLKATVFLGIFRGVKHIDINIMLPVQNSWALANVASWK